MEKYLTLLEEDYRTVVKKYEPKINKEKTYQSERELEDWLIKTLVSQGYEYVNIHNTVELKNNLRLQLEKLNNFKFDDEDWETFYKSEIANNSFGIKEKSYIIQKDYIKPLKITKDNITKNIRLIDKDFITKNSLQVIHQLNQEGNAKNRYDVTILVNGFPLVHIELKKRGENIKDAFNQIKRYQRDSFWAEDGLFEYVQIYVISNGTYTLYYSNSTRYNIEKDNNTFNPLKKSVTSNSFEFTINWADEQNNHIDDLEDFTNTFFASRTLLNILTQYCVLNSNNELIVMRPYQIAATENIISKIKMANYNHWQGSKKAGGYIWHTTGSGKTLTSFKAAQLASNLEFIDKVIFVVDRKDLYIQTIKEYRKLDEDSFDETSNSVQLRKKLENTRSKILVTTIQKMSKVLNSSDDKLSIYDKNVVIIFDECHRSQFGSMHKSITTKFKKYFLFGFTGTPIFAKNANLSNKILFNNKPVMLEKTTYDLFGDRLHTYTIKQALIDKKVLPFNVQYWETIKIKSDVKDEKVKQINTEELLLNDERITKNVQHILNNFYQITKHGSVYELNVVKKINDKAKNQIEIKDGFNSIFTCSSIDALRKYYVEFKKQIRDSNDEKIKKLKIATIFSYSVNQKEPDGELQEEIVDDFSWENLVDQDFLKQSIKNYENDFNISINTSSPNWFYNYYQDISEKTRNKEIDILLVVNMFLTGFDAPALNTLWVDRNLEMHGLIQAFSRTNRILKETKNAGNIVCFRNLREEVEDAIKTFSNEDESGIILLRTFKEYYEGYIDNKGKQIKGYKEVVDNFINEYPVTKDLGLLVNNPDVIKDFISKFNDILRRQNILLSFSEFNEEKAIISDRDLQNYLSTYHLFKNEVETKIKNEKTSVYNDVVFEMELISEQAYNVSEIIALMKEKELENKHEKDKITINLKVAIEAASIPKSKKQLLLEFLESLNGNTQDFDSTFNQFINESYSNDLLDIVSEFNLDGNELQKFMNNQFKQQEFNPIGEGTRKLLPKKINRFAAEGYYDKLKSDILLRLHELFDKYSSIYKVDY